MLQMSNHSPFETSVLVFPNQQGMDTLYVVVKATFDLAPQVEIAEEQRPIVMGDEYWGEPGVSSVKYASEAHLEKPGTDVVVVGEACAPHGKPVTELEVGLSVAGRSGGFTVFGDRHWKGSALFSRPSKPEPFVRMPLVYERAFGGMNTVMTDKGEKIYSEPRNPVGRGFKGKRSFEEIGTEPLPPLEWIARITSRIPKKGAKQVIYYGAYSQGMERPRAPSGYFNNSNS
ncbi:MAG: DUF2169 domain-containing protein [Candidatus Aegiribacteria sp.]|nr:DUF2169 domain-containing protein [Candidatus Aegiribacteria sp.]